MGPHKRFGSAGEERNASVQKAAYSVELTENSWPHDEPSRSGLSKELPLSTSIREMRNGAFTRL